MHAGAAEARSQGCGHLRQRHDEDCGGEGMNRHDAIVKAVLKYYPDAQAIYLFGSYGTDVEWADSDADIALLLPPPKSKDVDSLAMSGLRSELESALEREVDLVNLRQVSTVLQKEVVAADRRIYYADEYAADEFEMLTISYYQKLNEERAEILEEALASGRFHRL